MLIYVELLVAFSTVDTDNDGQITVDEVEKTMKSLRIVDVRREDVERMVDLVDTDGWFESRNTNSYLWRRHCSVCSAFDS